MTSDIRDISDKGRKQNKRLRYEVLMCVTPHPDEERADLIAKFRNWLDAKRFAENLATTPDATLVIIRS